MHDDALKELFRRVDAGTSPASKAINARGLQRRLRRRRTVQAGGMGLALSAMIVAALAFRSSREISPVAPHQAPKAIAASDTKLDELVAEQTLAVYAKLQREKSNQRNPKLSPEQTIEQLRSQAAITMLRYGDSLTDKANEPKLAAEMYRRTNELFPGTRGADDARGRLARMGS